MAEISIPPPDANGYWHFTYITTDTETGEWYGGKRSTKKHPLSDPYKGSGNWVRQHPARGRLKREIVAFYATSVDVFAAEMVLITWDEVLNDPLCMNRNEGGRGFTTEGARRIAADPAWKEKNLAAARVRSASSDWRKKNAAANRRHASDPEWLAALAGAVKKQWATPERWAIALAAGRRTAQNPIWQAKNSECLQRLHADPAFRAAHAAGLANRSAEWRANVVAAIRRRASDPIWLEANAARNRRTGADPEVCAKKSAGAIRRYSDPAERQRSSVIAFRREAAKRAAKALLMPELPLFSAAAAD
jgi:hypothetical protein